MSTFHIAESTEARHFPPDCTVIFDLATDPRSSPAPISLEEEGKIFTFTASGSYRIDFQGIAIPYSDIFTALIRFESESFSPRLQDTFGTTRAVSQLAGGRLPLAASTILPLEAGRFLTVRIHMEDKFILEKGARLIITRLA